MKLKKGDTVIVLAGKDKGQKGKIEKVLPKKNMVLLPGINQYKRHLRPQGEKKPGGIVDIIKPLPVSRVAFWCSKCQKATRVGYQFDHKGNKFRICKKCQKAI